MPRSSHEREAVRRETAALKNLTFLDDNKLHRAVTIQKKPQEVFEFWRNFSNMPLFMKDVAKVEITTPKTSHWLVQLKTGLSAEWDAVITEEREGKMISWCSVENSPVQTSGTVWFEIAPARQGTIVRLSMDYKVPGGKLADLASALTGESPDMLICTNLKRLKALLETGEIPTTEGQPSGRDENHDNHEIHEKKLKH